MFSSNEEILTELFFLPPPLVELPPLLADLCSLHNLHLLVLSSKSRARIQSYSRSYEFFVNLKTTGRHSGCENTSMRTRNEVDRGDKQTKLRNAKFRPQAWARRPLGIELNVARPIAIY